LETVLVATEPVSLRRFKLNLVHSRPQTVNPFSSDKIVSRPLADLKSGLALAGSIRPEPDPPFANLFVIPNRIRGHIEVDNLQSMASSTSHPSTIIPDYTALKHNGGADRQREPKSPHRGFLLICQIVPRELDASLSNF
jgi:hypothetical protein